MEKSKDKGRIKVGLRIKNMMNGDNKGAIL